MGSDFDIKGEGESGTPFMLPRQLSIYSLTFDEFQSTVGGIGKDFGSMNMDELLKNIWSAEENNNFGSAIDGSGTGTGTGTGVLQRQGSLTLPRTVSQKTVDEVWRDMSREFGVVKRDDFFSQTQRQQTLGEVTLEEFLVRAGVVREEIHPAPNPNSSTSSGLGYVYQTGNSANLGLDSKGARHQHLSPQNHHPFIPNQPASTYGAPVRNHHFSGNGTGTGTGTRNGILDIPEQTMNTNNVLQNLGLPGGALGMVSPLISPSNGEPSSSVSPVPYSFNVRKTPAIEKVVERRQRRMIKNRESAARSRARKQAHTVELEGEVAKLKEENEHLRKKQAELVEMHKNQVLEIISQQKHRKKICLRRTESGPK